MAGLQTIINYCNGLTINRRKMVGIQFTRNEQPRTSLTPTTNPWRFTLEIANRFRYYNSRDLLEAIDTLDRYQAETITFNNLAAINWIFKYQGSLNSTQLNAMTVQSFVGNQLVLQNLPGVASTRVIFEPNDLIQIGSIPHPFTSETRITRGTGSTITVTTNRGNWFDTSVVGESITVGSGCEFKMFCPNMPTYKLIPGGYKSLNGQTLNNALIEFSDNFELYEYVESV